MRLGRAPIDEQVNGLREALRCNEVLMEIIARTPRLGLPDWYLAAGAVTQTVWNVVTRRPATHGINDYDLIYFHPDDLSWEAEDAVIRQAGDLFADLDAPVEVRNEARVHLWYEARFGVPRTPYTSVEDAIDSFPALSSRIGVRLVSGRWRVYAPSGLSDLFNLVVRANPDHCGGPPVQEVYERKTTRWRREWPELTVLPWPVPAADDG